MKNYVKKTLQKLLHNAPSRAQHAPHTWTTPTYGQTRQYAPPPDTTTILNTQGIKRVQKVVGSFYTTHERSITQSLLLSMK